MFQAGSFGDSKCFVVSLDGKNKMILGQKFRETATLLSFGQLTADLSFDQDLNVPGPFL